jgi:hypothetical protein
MLNNLKIIFTLLRIHNMLNASLANLIIRYNIREHSRRMRRLLIN